MTIKKLQEELGASRLLVEKYRSELEKYKSQLEKDKNELDRFSKSRSAAHRASPSDLSACDKSSFIGFVTNRN